MKRGTDLAVVGVRVQDHCARRGWWLRCAQEPFEESGQPHLVSVEQPFLAYRPPCPWPPEPFSSAATQWIAAEHLSTRSGFKTSDGPRGDVKAHGVVVGRDTIPVGSPKFSGRSRFRLYRSGSLCDGEPAASSSGANGACFVARSGSWWPRKATPNLSHTEDISMPYCR